ncbi:hypothetical protein BJX61DRAFT_544793 [Aspergillus egyptiacus]|nr:hypothetical protein BJX61DRAFT_544793 [Aspergillus egyptiacus]
MQFSTLFVSAFALFGSVALAAPKAAPVENARVRTSCQLGDIFGGADAACSASCIAQGQGWHGGYCNDQMVCNCTY